MDVNGGFSVKVEDGALIPCWRWAETESEPVERVLCRYP